MAPRPAIAIRLHDDPRQPSIEIDGLRVARGLGLDVTAFRQRMAERKVSVLCERGTGEDAGRWRATFGWKPGIGGRLPGAPPFSATVAGAGYAVG